MDWLILLVAEALEDLSREGLLEDELECKSFFDYDFIDDIKDYLEERAAIEGPSLDSVS